MTSGASPLLTTAVFLLVSFLMTLSGRTKKRIELRSPSCPICRQARKSCTCRWL